MALSLLAVPSSAAEGPPGTEPEVPVPPAVSPLQTGRPDLPGAEDLPPLLSASALEGTVTSAQGTVVNRSRMWIEVDDPDDPMWGAMFGSVHNAPMENPTSYLQACAHGRPETCVPNPFYQPACATDDPATQLGVTYIQNLLYPVRPLDGGGAEVGFLAQTRVNLVAFGSIPATATVTMRVPRLGGEVQPLMAHVWDTQTPGGGIGASECDPGFRSPLSTLVEGQVEIWLSDLEVDGMTVDLGTQCRTEEPAQVYLWGDSSQGPIYYPLDGGNLGAYDGLHPGSILPLDHPMYQGRFDGRDIPASTGVEVPAFTGCGAGDDLSALVTAMASGPNNPVKAVQDRVVLFNRIPLEDFTTCANLFRCPLPAPSLPAEADGSPVMPPLPWRTAHEFPDRLS